MNSIEEIIVSKGVQVEVFFFCVGLFMKWCHVFFPMLVGLNGGDSPFVYVVWIQLLGCPVGS